MKYLSKALRPCDLYRYTRKARQDNQIIDNIDNATILEEFLKYLKYFEMKYLSKDLRAGDLYRYTRKSSGGEHDKELWSIELENLVEPRWQFGQRSKFADQNFGGDGVEQDVIISVVELEISVVM
ncbi:5574_t:CDS:2 [Funneliformis mosseae]|uniref:5574_t:CDS:1 n=1 Tax=Funneliformis mosseae TaxID=27381 RepID=A0A9N9CGW5_FUNMO|nr:5574_t:CDS:2 [Funneliformis mosseae]